MIHSTTVLLTLGALASGLVAQSDDAKYQKKLTKEFVKHANWVTSLDAAMTKAEAENKLIFGYFTRSYSP